MADTRPPPTDDEIAALRSEFGITSNGRGIKEFTQVRDFARAVLAKWGAAAPVGVEPYGYVYAAQVATRVGDERKVIQTFFTQKKPPWEALPLYTTPQPTQAQAEPKSGAKSFQTYGEANAYSKGYYAGKKAATQAQARAVPLTKEQAASLCKTGPVYAPDGRVVRTPEQYRRELEGAKLAGIRTAERAHGITGGQHVGNVD